MTKDKKQFRESLFTYCMQIPGSLDILRRMEKIDKETKQNQNKNLKGFPYTMAIIEKVMLKK